MSSNSLFTALVFSVLFFCVISSPPVIFHSKVTEETINKICDLATPFASECRNALNSNPKTPDADINQLCQIALDLVFSDIFKTFAVLNRVVIGTKDPKEKELFQGCLNDYKDISTAIGAAQTNLNPKGDFSAIADNAGTMFDKSNGCLNRFETPSVEIETRTNSTLACVSVVYSIALYVLDPHY